MKKVLVVGLVLVFLVLFVCFVWFSRTSVQNSDSQPNSDSVPTSDNYRIENATTTTPTEATESPSAGQPVERVTVDTATLGDGQQQLLKTFGIEGEIEITPEMQQCAEEKIGAERLGEIIAGATPSFMEGVSLASCY